MRLATMMLSAGCLLLAADTSIFQVRMVQDAPSPDSEPMAYHTADGQSLTLPVQKTVLLDKSAIVSAVVARDSSTGRPQVRIMLTPEGQAKFAEITAQSIHKQLAVVVHGRVVEAPMVQARLNTTFIPILGDLGEQGANRLAAKINAALTKH